MSMDSKLMIVLNVAIAYIAGTLVRAPWRILKGRIDEYYFGENPRNVYTTKATEEAERNKKRPVIKELATRKIADGLVDSIIEHNPCLNGEDDKIKSHFAFGYMVNYLGANGKSSKLDRIGSLTDMCSSVMVTILICSLMLAGSAVLTSCGFDPGLSWDLTWLSGGITLIVLLAGFLSSASLYAHYTQVRFSMTITQYSMVEKK